MLDILTASPSVGAHRVEPLSITEIDAHPDVDRIWATIRAIQSHGEDEYQRGWDEADDTASSAEREEREHCREAIADAVERILDQEDDFREASDPVAAILAAVGKLGDVL